MAGWGLVGGGREGGVEKVAGTGSRACRVGDGMKWQGESRVEQGGRQYELVGNDRRAGQVGVRLQGWEECMQGGRLDRWQGREECRQGGRLGRWWWQGGRVGHDRMGGSRERR